MITQEINLLYESHSRKNETGSALNYLQAGSPISSSDYKENVTTDFCIDTRIPVYPFFESCNCGTCSPSKFWMKVKAEGLELYPKDRLTFVAGVRNYPSGSYFLTISSGSTGYQARFNSPEALQSSCSAICTFSPIAQYQGPYTYNCRAEAERRNYDWLPYVDAAYLEIEQADLYGQMRATSSLGGYFLDTSSKGCVDNLFNTTFSGSTIGIFANPSYFKRTLMTGSVTPSQIDVQSVCKRGLKVYGVQIGLGDNLLYDFRPWKDPWGVPCFRNLITGSLTLREPRYNTQIFNQWRREWFYNLGKGVFLYG